MTKSKKNDKIPATVLKSEQGKVTVRLEIEGYDKNAEFRYASGIEAGKKILVKISNIQGRGNNKTLQVSFLKML